MDKSVVMAYQWMILSSCHKSAESFNEVRIVYILACIVDLRATFTLRLNVSDIVVVSEVKREVISPAKYQKVKGQRSSRM